MDNHYYAIDRSNRALSHKRNHKYIAKVQNGRKARYFYSQKDYMAYLKLKNTKQGGLSGSDNQTIIRTRNRLQEHLEHPESNSYYNPNSRRNRLQQFNDRGKHLVNRFLESLGNYMVNHIDAKVQDNTRLNYIRRVWFGTDFSKGSASNNINGHYMKKREGVKKS